MRKLLSLLAFASLTAAFAAPAAAGDVSLDNVTVKEKDITVQFRHISVVGTNLTSDEVSRLFSDTADKDARDALLAKMKAASISIPETKVTLKNGSLVFHDWEAKNVDSGVVGDISLAGFDGSFDGPRHMPITIKSNAVSATNANLIGAFAPAKAPSAAQGSPRAAHFLWSGFQASVPDKTTPQYAVGGNLWKVSLGSVEGSGSYQGLVPLKSSAAMKDLVIQPPPASKAAKMFGAFGYKKLDLGMTMAGTYDPAKHAYTLADYTVNGVDAGAIGFKALFSSVESAVFSAPAPARMAAIDEGVVNSVEMRIVNGGLFQKTLAWYAAQRGQTVDELRRQWAAAATLLIPVMLKGDPDGPRIAEAVTNFVNSPKALTVSIKAKGEGVKVGDLKALFSAKTLLSHLDVQATAGP